MTYIPSTPAPISTHIVYGRSANFGKEDGENLLRPIIEDWMPLQAADTLVIVSTSVEDEMTTGDGAWIVRLTGIGADGLIQTEDVELDGTTPVASSEQWLAVNKAEVIEGAVGVSGFATNLGAISIKDTLGGTTQAHIGAGLGCSEQAAFRVPLAKRLLIDKIELKAAAVSSTLKPLITFKGYIITADKVKVELFNEVLDTSATNKLTLGSGEVPFEIPAGAQVIVTASSEFDASFASAKMYSKLMVA